MAGRSIAWRVAIGLSVGAVALWLGAAAIASNVMQRELDAAFDEALRQAALRLLPLAVFDAAWPDGAAPTPPALPGLGAPGFQPPPGPAERRVGGLPEGDEAFTYHVRDRDGRVFVSAQDAPVELSGIGLQDGFSEIDGRRAYALTDPRSGYGIVVVEREGRRPTVFSVGPSAVTWPLAGLIPIVAVGIWGTVRLAMRPVERLGHAIANRDSRNLTPLVADDHPVELAPIAEAVVSLLDRLRDALNAERAFAASSAHELRTPIAGALAQVQRLAIELGEHPGRERLREVEAALRHLGRLAERLLQLARLEAGFVRAEAETDLLPALNVVARDFRSVAAADRIRIDVADDASLRARVNVDAFAIAVRNLIQNGLIHGGPDAAVEVSVDSGNTVRVRNTGPVVPPEVLERLGKPFVRGETSAEGTGLGLSIVRSIMDQIGGTLTLASPPPGSKDGFEAKITLPKIGRPGQASRSDG